MPGDRDLTIREICRPGEIKLLSALIGSIWERPQDPLVSSDMLLVLAHAGNYVAGAWEGEELLGGLVGFLGRRGGEPVLHSYVCGVRPDAQALGVGYQLKMHQRAWARRRGLREIAWVFDPLVRRNAHFNLLKLGARVDGYLPDFYGEMPDPINAGDLSDRLSCRWSPGLEAGPVWAGGALPALSVGEGGEPLLGPASSGRRFCQVPADIVSVRRRRPELAREWRLALRRVLGGALERGERVLGLTADGCYLLE